MNCFVDFELSKFKANNTDFRTGKPVNTAPDWTDHVMGSANHCARISVLFVSKAIMYCIVLYYIVMLSSHLVLHARKSFKFSVAFQN